MLLPLANVEKELNGVDIRVSNYLFIVLVTLIILRMHFLNVLQGLVVNVKSYLRFYFFISPSVLFNIFKIG